MARLEWYGDDFRRRVDQAQRAAVAETVAAAAERARSSHPGWKNVTGATEASITALGEVERDRRGVVGRFGSRLAHFLFLEIGFRGRAGDHTLRRALDVEGGHLAERIGAHLEGQIAGGLTGRIGGRGSIGRVGDAHTDTSAAAASAAARLARTAADRR